MKPTVIALFLALATATAARAAPPAPVDPGAIFEELWTTLDQNYALFGVKGVDWQALDRVYRPQVGPGTTDEQLFSIVTRMLGHLNDNHVTLTTENPTRYYGAGNLYQLFSGEGDGVAAFRSFVETMSARPVPQRYFKTGLRETGGGVFAYGWAADGVGYIHFNRFADAKASAEAIDSILEAFEQAKTIIVDVRRNQGGDDRVGKIVADRFADRKRLYMTTRDRVGPGHDDFAEPRKWFVEPAGTTSFTGKVLLLTDRTSISAAENFALAMKVLPHVTQVGDLTSGCFADAASVTLSNGWKLSYSRNLFLDHEGRCWEGVGVPPEIRQVDDERDRAQGRDRVFELAVTLAEATRRLPDPGKE